MPIDGLVSTVIPVFNRPDLLREAVASVLAQTYRPIEVIIVDDGSTDETAAVAEGLAAESDGLISVIHAANGGPGAARELGRQRAQGEFLQYLDSDDLLLPEKFALQVAGLRADPGCGIAYGMTEYSVPGASSPRLPWKRTGEQIGTMFPSFLRSRWWGTSTPIYRRDITDRAGPWLAINHEEDWEYDCRIAAQGVRLHFVPDFVSMERDHGGDRLSGGGADKPQAMADRAIAHRQIFLSARRAGIGPDAPEMRHFARELFLLARQCGAAGLATQARELFALARTASEPQRRDGWDFRLYGALAGLIGWDRAGRLACNLDKLRL